MKDARSHLKHHRAQKPVLTGLRLMSNPLDVQVQGVSNLLKSLIQAVDTHDIYAFRQHNHKLIGVLKLIELEKLVTGLEALDRKCIAARDLVLHEIEIQHVLRDINCYVESTRRIFAVEKRRR